MAKRVVKAKDLKVGDILDGTLSHGVMSIKEIQRRVSPLGTEITVIGPLHIMEKYHPDSYITILI